MNFFWLSCIFCYYIIKVLPKQHVIIYTIQGYVHNLLFTRIFRCLSWCSSLEQGVVHPTYPRIQAGAKHDRSYVFYCQHILNLNFFFLVLNGYHGLGYTVFLSKSCAAQKPSLARESLQLCRRDELAHLWLFRIHGMQVCAILQNKKLRKSVASPTKIVPIWYLACGNTCGCKVFQVRPETPQQPAWTNPQKGRNVQSIKLPLNLEDHCYWENCKVR